MRLKIKEALQHAGLTGKEVARRLGIAEGTFSGYASGKHDPKPQTLAQIAQICGVSADYLLGLAAAPPGQTGRPGALPGLGEDEFLDSILENYAKANQRGRRQMAEQCEQIIALEKNQAGRQTGTVSA